MKYCKVSPQICIDISLALLRSDFVWCHVRDSIPRASGDRPEVALLSFKFEVLRWVTNADCRQVETKSINQHTVLKPHPALDGILYRQTLLPVGPPGPSRGGGHRSSSSDQQLFLT
jgi:hypothetical protein